ncbi:hypothetical protein Tco_0223622 [Tanacetum coccineum]
MITINYLSLPLGYVSKLDWKGLQELRLNGINAYEIKGKFLDDLLDNAFSGTNGEDTVEHIEYFLKIVDHINLPNVNYEHGSIHQETNNDDEQETAEIFRIETNLFDYETPLCKEFKKFNLLLKVDPELFTHDIERTKTYEDYENKLNDELEEPWSKDGVPHEMCDHICEPFCFKNGKAKLPTCNSNEDGFCNGGELPGMVRVGYMTYFQDYEWSFISFHKLDYELLVKLQDYWWKVNDHECSPFSKGKDHIRGPYINFFTTYDPHLDINSIFDDQVSFGQDEEYAAIKEYEYDDLTKTNEDACQAYQEIYRIMDDGWVDLAGKEIEKVGRVSISLESYVCCSHAGI